MSRAARAVDRSRMGAYKARDVDAQFAEDWDEALLEATDGLHYECYRRAVEGVPEPVFYQGDECGTITRYSDSLLMSLLKAHDPRFRPKLEHSVDGELADRLARALQRQQGAS